MGAFPVNLMYNQLALDNLFLLRREATALADQRRVKPSYSGIVDAYLDGGAVTYVRPNEPPICMGGDPCVYSGTFLGLIYDTPIDPETKKAIPFSWKDILRFGEEDATAPAQAYLSTMPADEFHRGPASAQDMVDDMITSRFMEALNNIDDDVDHRFGSE
jgi:hypothetical protein